MAAAAPAPQTELYEMLGKRIRTARALLRSVTEPVRRKELVMELDAATQELTALVLGSKAPKKIA